MINEKDSIAKPYILSVGPDAFAPLETFLALFIRTGEVTEAYNSTIQMLLDAGITTVYLNWDKEFSGDIRPCTRDDLTQHLPFQVVERAAEILQPDGVDRIVACECFNSAYTRLQSYRNNSGLVELQVQHATLGSSDSPIVGRAFPKGDFKTVEDVVKENGVPYAAVSSHNLPGMTFWSGQSPNRFLKNFLANSPSQILMIEYNDELSNFVAHYLMEIYGTQGVHAKFFHDLRKVRLSNNNQHPLFNHLFPRIQNTFQDAVTANAKDFTVELIPYPEKTLIYIKRE